MANLGKSQLQIFLRFSKASSWFAICQTDFFKILKHKPKVLNYLTNCSFSEVKKQANASKMGILILSNVGFIGM